MIHDVGKRHITEYLFQSVFFRYSNLINLMEVKNMIEKQQPIVALGHSSKPKKARPPRNNLLLSLKKNDLELNFYSSLDPEIMNKLLEKVLP